MKRIALIILTMLLLAACVPTPEQEFVVNKGDSIAEQKINETSGAGQARRPASGVRPSPTAGTRNRLPKARISSSARMPTSAPKRTGSIPSTARVKRRLRRKPSKTLR